MTCASARWPSGCKKYSNLGGWPLWLPFIACSALSMAVSMCKIWFTLWILVILSARKIISGLLNWDMGGLTFNFHKWLAKCYDQIAPPRNVGNCVVDIYTNTFLDPGLEYSDYYGLPGIKSWTKVTYNFQRLLNVCVCHVSDSIPACIRNTRILDFS